MNIGFNDKTPHLPLAFVGGTILWGSVAARRPLFLGESADSPALGLGGRGSWGTTLREDKMSCNLTRFWEINRQRSDVFMSNKHLWWPEIRSMG